MTPSTFAPIAEPMNASSHIVVAIMLPYSRSGDFWGRDAGLLARGFRELGYKTTFVALPGSEEIREPEGHEKEGCQLAGIDKLQSPGWWKHLAPDAVVLFGWTLPRFQAVRDAILAVTPNLVERMDTDGMRSALLNPARYFYLMWAQAMDRREAQSAYSWSTIPSAGSAIARTARSIIGTPVFGVRAAKTAARIPVVLVESPVALERIKRWQGMFGHSGENIHFVPHASDIQSLPTSTPGKKRPERIVAVGRWRSFSKHYKLTWKVARDFLSTQQDYEFHFLGESPSRILSVDRMFHHGKKSRYELGRFLCTSQIIFAASRYESFHLGTAEALCCGCSSVMPVTLPTSEWFAGSYSGTTAKIYEKNALVTALLEETKMWKSGQRQPEKIAAHWREIMSPARQAESIIDKLMRLERTNPTRLFANRGYSCTRA